MDNPESERPHGTQDTNNIELIIENYIDSPK